MADTVSEGQRWKHLKRGTEYEIIGVAELQIATFDLVDGSELVLYRGEDGKLWAREEAEFTDGRFILASTQPAPAFPREEGLTAREAVNTLDWTAIYKEARKRCLDDATGTFYDEHLARTLADRLAALLQGKQP